MPKKQVYNTTFLLLTRRCFLFLNVHPQMFACPTFCRNYRKSCLSLMTGTVQSNHILNKRSHIFLSFYAESSILSFFRVLIWGWWVQISFKQSFSNTISITCQKWKWHMNHSNTATHEFVDLEPAKKHQKSTWFQSPVSFRDLEQCVKVHLFKDHLINDPSYKDYRHNWLKWRTVLTENISVQIFQVRQWKWQTC